MNIQMVNVVIYVLIITLILYCFFVKNKTDRKWVVFVKNHLFVFVFLLAVNTLSFAVSMKEKKSEIYIERQELDGSDDEYTFEAKIEGETIPFKLNVPPKKLKPKEAKALMDEAIKYLDEHVKGENVSLEKVDEPLDFSLDRKKYPFEVEVMPGDYGLVDEDGNLRNHKEQLENEGYSGSEMSSGILTEVKIVLNYDEIEREKTYAFKVFPKEESNTEKIISEIERLYKRKESESAYEDGFFLPASYKGIDIVSLKENVIRPEGVLIIGLLIALLLILREAENKKNNELQRNRELLQAYPWFVNEMVLLLGAGMQVKNVFSLLIEEGADANYRATLIAELQRSVHDFDIGMSETKIYYNLGRRLKLPCYIKLLTLLEQNVTKGSKGLVAVLEQEENNALFERINLAKKRGEEAGTKLLGPMIILLIIVMLIIMVPAFMSFT